MEFRCIGGISRKGLTKRKMLLQTLHPGLEQDRGKANARAADTLALHFSSSSSQEWDWAQRAWLRLSSEEVNGPSETN